MKQRFAVLAALTVTAFPAFAEREGFTDEARVLDARQVREVIPIKREECWNERVRGYENRTVTRTDTNQPLGAGAVLGAIAGGVIGHQFGNSSGSRDRATAAGAIVGGIVGHQVEKENQGEARRETTTVERVPTGRTVERCRVVEERREAVIGYDVRYSYRGREFTTRTQSHPGRTLKVAVRLRPIEDETDRDAPRSPAPPRY